MGKKYTGSFPGLHLHNSKTCLLVHLLWVHLRVQGYGKTNSVKGLRWIISVKCHSVLTLYRFLCAYETEKEREREREISHCLALKCTNPQLGFLLYVFVRGLRVHICLMSEIRDEQTHTPLTPTHFQFPTAPKTAHF